jgi:hypothetical protein
VGLPHNFELRVMLLAFGDDSADGNQDRVFCVAAVVGSPSDWEVVEAEWSKHLGCPQIPRGRRRRRWAIAGLKRATGEGIQNRALIVVARE